MAAFDPATILAALRTTGNNQLADELERGQQPALQQQPAPALQQQDPVAQPTPTPVQEAAPVEPPQVEDKSWNPRAGAGQLSGDVAQGQQRALDLVTQQGDVKAGGSDRQAELYGELEGQRKGRLDTATKRLDGNRGQKDALEREMFAKLDEISEREKNPPKDVMGMVMGILGAAMAAKGNQGGAVAASMIGQAMGSKTQQWQRELESDRASVGRMKTMFDLQNDDSNNELDQESKVSTLMAGQFDAALKKVGAETDSKEIKVASEAARNELRLKYGQHQLSIKQRQAAAAGNDELWKLSIQDLSSLMAQGKLGKEGQAVLTEKMKREQGVRKGEADIGQTEASAAKAAADADKSRQEAGAPGAPKKLTEGEAKTDAVVGGAVDSYKRLAQSVAGGDEVNRGALRETWVPDALTSQKSLQQRADITNVVRSILRVESGSNVPDSEVEGKIEGLGLDSGDPEIRNAGMRQLLGGFKAIDRQGRLGGITAPQQQPAQQAPAQSVPQQASVTMYRPDGRAVSIRADMVEAAKSRGYSSSAPTGQPALSNVAPPGLESRIGNERTAR